MQSDIAGISESGNVYRSSIKAKKGHTVVVMHPGRQVISYPLEFDRDCPLISFFLLSVLQSISNSGIVNDREFFFCWQMIAISLLRPDVCLFPTEHKRWRNSN
jgi:hypothetical protein